MSEGGISTRVRDFVIRHITSVEQMELLLLFAAEPEKSRTIGQLITEIRSSSESVGKRVKQLTDEGFLTGDGETFRFAPASPETVAVISELASAYGNYRVRMIELIYSRAGGLKNFSDAFKFKQKE